MPDWHSGTFFLYIKHCVESVFISARMHGNGVPAPFSLEKSTDWHIDKCWFWFDSFQWFHVLCIWIISSIHWFVDGKIFQLFCNINLNSLFSMYNSRIISVATFTVLYHCVSVTSFAILTPIHSIRTQHASSFYYILFTILTRTQHKSIYYINYNINSYSV